MQLGLIKHLQAIAAEDAKKTTDDQEEEKRAARKAFLEKLYRTAARRS